MLLNVIFFSKEEFQNPFNSYIKDEPTRCGNEAIFTPKKTDLELRFWVYVIWRNDFCVPYSKKT